MNLKIKRKTEHGYVRKAYRGDIKEILINEDIMDPDGEVIKVCYRGMTHSGIIEFRQSEFEKLANSMKGREKLVKGFKVFRGKGI